jgi:hypothetical protein
MNAYLFAEHGRVPAAYPIRAKRQYDEADADRSFDRAAADLQDIVQMIATRYRRRGAPLTWRLLHEIENEALSDLGLAGRHDAELLAMFVRPPSATYPCSDNPVDLRGDPALPLLFWFVLDVYGVTHAKATPHRASRQA